MKAKHDESKAREIIKKLLIDDGGHKREAAKTKKEESKAKGSTSKHLPATSTENISKTKGKTASVERLDKAAKSTTAAAAAKAKSTSRENLAQSKPKTSTSKVKASSSSMEPANSARWMMEITGLTREGSAGDRAISAASSGMEPADPEHWMTVTGLISEGSSGGGSMSVAEMTRQSGQKPAFAQSKQVARTKIYGEVGKTFESSLLCAPKGPDPANAKGPNPVLLLPEWVLPLGPQNSNRKGPQRSNKQGPARRTQNCGPQASNWSGPGDLAKGSIYKCEALYALV